MRRFVAVAIGMLAFIGVQAPAGAAGVPAVGVVSANDYVNGSCSAGMTARRFTATLAGTYPVSANKLQAAALSFRALHSCTGQVGAVSLTGQTMSGVAVASSCAGGMSNIGTLTVTINVVCQTGTRQYRLQIAAVRDVLSSINPFTVNRGLIGVPSYVGTYTIQSG